MRLPLNVVIGQQDMSEALEQAVRGTVADTVGGYMAEQIGAGYHNLTHKSILDVITHKVLHGLNGAVTGAILTGEDGIASGAMGAMVAESVIEIMMPDRAIIEARLAAGEDPAVIKREGERIADVARMAAASAALVTHQDVPTSIHTATLAVENNALQFVIPTLVAAGAKVLWEAYNLYFPDEIEDAKDNVCQYIADETGLPVDQVRLIGEGVMMGTSMTRAVKTGGTALMRSLCKKSIQEIVRDQASSSIAPKLARPKLLASHTSSTTTSTTSSTKHVDVTQKNTITIEYKEGMDVRDFDRKTKALQDLAERGKLVKTQPMRDENLTAKYRKNILDAAKTKFKESNPTKYEQLKLKIENMDADHLHELQLGGSDHRGMLTMLEKKVNRSIGSQVRHQMKDLPIGTKIDKIDIKGPNQ